MTKIAIQPNASGTGTFTIAAPNSNDNRTFTLPDATGEVLTDAENNPAKLFRRDNILGTVSQSGGVPTGAIIESGSNANGEFVKYADGTMICYGREVLTFPANSEQANALTVTYAASFDIGTIFPTVMATLSRNAYAATTAKMFAFTGDLTTSSFTLRAWNLATATSSQDRVFHWSAIGRWF